MDNMLKLVQELGKHIGEPITIRQLAKNTKIPYTTTLRIINQEQVFHTEKKGNTRLITLNKDDLVKHYLIISEHKKRQEFWQQQPFMKVLKQDIIKGNYVLLLFGSRASNTQREQSDIDLCVINEDGKNEPKFKHTTILKKEVNPMYFKDEEFKDMLQSEQHNVAKEIMRNHIILYGEEKYWEMVWNIAKNSKSF